MVKFDDRQLSVIQHPLPVAEFVRTCDRSSLHFHEPSALLAADADTLLKQSVYRQLSNLRACSGGAKGGGQPGHGPRL